VSLGAVTGSPAEAGIGPVSLCVVADRPAEVRIGPVSPGAVTGGIGEVVPHSVRKDTVSAG
jgi:hypothetical protein